MTVLAVILLLTAAAVAAAGRILAGSWQRSADRLKEQLRYDDPSSLSGDARPEAVLPANADQTDPEAWNAMWDAAEEEMNQDIRRLLSRTGRFAAVIAVMLAAAAAVIFILR